MTTASLPFDKPNTHPTVTLHHGDCLEVMPTLAPKRVQMVFADLPYQCTKNKWDISIDPKVLWGELSKVCDKDAIKLLTANQKFACVMIAANAQEFRYDLIWEKTVATGHLNAKKMPMRAHESILIFFNKSKTYNPQMSEGKPYLFTHKTFTSNYGKQNGAPRISHGTRHPRSVIKINNPNKGSHPTQKPVALLEWLIKTYTNLGDTVLDPVFGSCTTGVACLRTGRNFIGIEKDAAYFEIGRKRIAEEQSKLGFEVRV